MITEESNINIKPRSTLKIGDLAVIHAAVTTKNKFWNTLFYKHWSEFAVLCLRQYFRFNRAIMASQLWSVFRFNPGFQTMGLLSTLASICCLLSYNSSNVVDWLKPLSIFIIPFMPFFESPEGLYQLAVIDIESPLLLAYTGLFILSSLFHLVTIWIGRGNKSITKRGESWIGLALSKYMKVDEFLIGMLEVLIVIAMGLSAWKWAGDVHFSIYMLLISLSEASQLILDKAHQAHTQSILRA